LSNQRVDRAQYELSRGRRFFLIAGDAQKFHPYGADPAVSRCVVGYSQYDEYGFMARRLAPAAALGS
jgi:hypothetical protein